MIRGDLVVLALQGSHGKPRPALVIQSDVFAASSHVAVLPLTSDANDAALLRVPIAATGQESGPARRTKLLQRSRSIIISRLILLANFAISMKTCCNSGSWAKSACAFS